MRVLLVDDESAARRRLARLLTNFPDVEIIGEAQNGLDAIPIVESLNPDLVFLDIRMPVLDGFGVIRAVPSTMKMPLVIFATSYDDYALEAFDANAIAYLLKPIEIPRLTSALERVRRLLDSEKERAEDEEHIQALAVSTKQLNRIVCRKHNRLVLIDPAEILWFYIDEGIVRAQTTTENYWANYQLNQLEAGLDPELFFRARRETLVNLSKVKAVKPYDGSTFALVMNDAQETELVVSERRAKDLRSRLPGL
jgi:two-component system, LytTR family, response regulator